MSDEIPVRVAGAEFRFDREHYTRGDELEVPERTLEAHPRTLKRVEETETEPEAEETTVQESEDVSMDGELDPHPQELTVDELERRVQDVTDVDLLERILAAETESNDPRSTAVDALENRLDELED
ncbi:hypothetical protein [Halorarum salinum]|uniref:Uncharacterized protein n=1 Tax=Halorarum salinum TaxID=2743089 RepID=A0A7D5LC81_9EURY|nr:hypothetical protein [Halobaculum salinum]QLG63088.1 hypothetical protein HUG12_15645 [Halobaculum salinum]